MLSKKEISAEAMREKLTQAALSLLSEQGADAFTLDAVAKRAGVSKGGLLHHFPTKMALILHILRSLLNQFDQQVSARYHTLPEGKGRWLKAYVLITFQEEVPISLYVSLMLLGSALDSPELIALIIADDEMWNERLYNDGVPRARAEVIRKAANAHWQDQVLYSHHPNPTDTHALLQELLSLVESA
jgi:AcrR family transcriptional regulator